MKPTKLRIRRLLFLFAALVFVHRLAHRFIAGRNLRRESHGAAPAIRKEDEQIENDISTAEDSYKVMAPTLGEDLHMQDNSLQRASGSVDEIENSNTTMKENEGIFSNATHRSRGMITRDSNNSLAEHSEDQSDGIHVESEDDNQDKKWLKDEPSYKDGYEADETDALDGAEIIEMTTQKEGNRLATMTTSNQENFDIQHAGANLHPIPQTVGRNANDTRWKKVTEAGPDQHAQELDKEHNHVTDAGPDQRDQEFEKELHRVREGDDNATKL